MVYIARTKENLDKCQCMNCPSYTLGCKLKNMPGNLYKMMENLDNIEHFEGMYCAFEKSRCINEDKGCICSSCDIYNQYKLKKEDYCLANGGIKKKH